MAIANALFLAALKVPDIKKDMDNINKTLSPEAFMKAKNVASDVKNLKPKSQKLTDYTEGSAIPDVPKPPSTSSVSKRLFNMVNKNYYS